MEETGEYCEPSNSSPLIKSRSRFDIFMNFPVGIGAESKVLEDGICAELGGLSIGFVSASFLISSNIPLAR